MLFTEEELKEAEEIRLLIEKAIYHMLNYADLTATEALVLFLKEHKYKKQFEELLK